MGKRASKAPVLAPVRASPTTTTADVLERRAIPRTASSAPGATAFVAPLRCLTLPDVVVKGRAQKLPMVALSTKFVCPVPVSVLNTAICVKRSVWATQRKIFTINRSRKFVIQKQLARILEFQCCAPVASVFASGALIASTI